MKTKQVALGAAALIGIVAMPAAVAEVTFNGFGQVIYGQTGDEPGFGDLGYDDDGSFERETLFALQATAPVSDQLDAVAQIVARGSEDFDPEFAWAYLRYQINDEWSAKIGRQRMPLFRYSDYLEVGAAYPFMRVPGPVYDNPFRNYDGLNIGRGYATGDWELTGQLVYGTFDDTITADGQETDLRLPRIFGGALEATYGDWLSLRASAFRMKVSVKPLAMESLVTALVATGNADTAEDLVPDEETSTFVGLGAGINRGGVQLDAEYTYTKVQDSYVGKIDSWYVSAAYKVGAFTPVAYYGVTEAEPDRYRPLVPGTPAALVTGVGNLIAARTTENAYTSVGVRYDLSPGTALKFDYTHYEPKRGDAESVDLVAAGIVFSF